MSFAFADVDEQHLQLPHYELLWRDKGLLAGQSMLLFSPTYIYRVLLLWHSPSAALLCVHVRLVGVVFLLRCVIACRYRGAAAVHLAADAAGI